MDTCYEVKYTKPTCIGRTHTKFISVCVSGGRGEERSCEALILRKLS